MTRILHFFLLFLLFCQSLSATVKVGVDQLFTESYSQQLKHKHIGLITNQTAINYAFKSTLEILRDNAKSHNYSISAIFAPEHGLKGDYHAEDDVLDDRDTHGIPIHSLHGKNMRPTASMLESIDLLIYDIQDIGSRSYTYISTLFYVMEEAAKHKIPILVLDRPNPINGVTIDGPMLEEKWRSIVGYINVPYCHGMTVGELAYYFNEEYKIGCSLQVVPMKGWNRTMSFEDTGLPWIPTSPHVPEPSTAYYYPTTGILGELQIVNIGVGYTLPFKLVGAPWINADEFAKVLNTQKFPGVHFQPYYFRPFYGRFAQKNCQGVLINVTDPLAYKPVSTQFLIIGMLKHLYPQHFKEAIEHSKDRKNMFCKVTGTDAVYKLMTESKHIVWKLRGLHQKERAEFEIVRKKYLLADYLASS